MDILIPNFPGIKVIQPRILFFDENYTTKVDDLDNNLNININNVTEPVVDDMVKTRVRLSNYFDDDYSSPIIECLKFILSVNTDIIVYEVKVYNHYDNKEIVIYSDEKLNTKYLENKVKNRTSNLAKYELIDSSDNILDTIDKNLNEPQYCPKGAISVSKLYNVLNHHVINLNETIENLKNDLEEKISSFISENSHLEKVLFNFSQKELEILIDKSNGYYCNYLRLKFKVYNDNIIVPVDKQDSNTIELYKLIAPELYSLFNCYIENELLLNETRYNTNSIPTINSDCWIELKSKNIVSHFASDKNGLIIKHNNMDISEYEYTFEDIKLLEMILLKGNLDNLYDNIFVMIDDCPAFLQKIINDCKNNQLKQDIPNSEDLSINSENNSTKFKQKVKSLFNKRHN